MAYIDQQPSHIKRLLGNLHADNVDPEYWIQAISNGIVTIATDGSVAQKKGYFAVVFHTDNKSICYQGPCDGNDSLMTLYRTELTGILSALYLLRALSTFSHRDLTTTPTLFCDNSVAVTQTNLDISPGIRSHLAADYNIYSEITKLQLEEPKVMAAWVKAHQDNMK